MPAAQAPLTLPLGEGSQCCVMLKIGDFARLGRVSVKALRHYDEIGLLRPAHVDRVDGYRYYTPQQLTDLSEILLLKDFGFSLKKIGDLVRNRDNVVEAVEDRHRELQTSIADDLARLKRLEAFRAALTVRQIASVRLSSIEPALALTDRRLVQTGDGQIEQMFEDLERSAARFRARARSSPFLLFHVPTMEDALDVEACVPLRTEAAGRENARLVKGCATAGSITYRGHYAQTPTLFAALATWVDAHGGMSNAPLREVYHCFSADQRGYRLPARMLADSADGFVTELQAPLQNGGAHA